MGIPRRDLLCLLSGLGAAAVAAAAWVPGGLAYGWPAVALAGCALWAGRAPGGALLRGAGTFLATGAALLGVLHAGALVATAATTAHVSHED